MHCHKSTVNPSKLPETFALTLMPPSKMGPILVIPEFHFFVPRLQQNEGPLF